MELASVQFRKCLVRRLHRLIMTNNLINQTSCDICLRYCRLAQRYANKLKPRDVVLDRVLDGTISNIQQYKIIISQS